MMMPDLDPINLALSTGLGPLVALIIIGIIAGVAYKLGGQVAGIIAVVASATVLLLFNFLPVYVYITIVLAIGVIVGVKR